MLQIPILIEIMISDRVIVLGQFLSQLVKIGAIS